MRQPISERDRRLALGFVVLLVITGLAAGVGGAVVYGFSGFDVLCIIAAIVVAALGVRLARLPLDGDEQ